MGNNVIKRLWNKNTLTTIEDLRGMTFQAEEAGHTFEIRGVDGDGNTIALSGTPAGVMLRPDNTDVALTCAVSEGVVTATLPAECYDVPGRFGLTVYLTSDGQKTAIYAAIGSVSRTSSGNVSPGTTSSVVDLINAIEEAIEQIPASDTNLKAAMAATYSTSAVYPVGSYAWYNGKLYKCITAITSGETWTSAHWTEAKLGQDVSDLKSAYESGLAVATFAPGLTVGGYWKASDGTAATSNKYIKTTSVNFTKAGRSVIVLNDSTYEYCFVKFDANGTHLGNTEYLSGESLIPNGITKFGMNFRRKDQATVSDTDKDAILLALSAYVPVDKTLSQSNTSASSIDVGYNISGLLNVYEYLFSENQVPVTFIPGTRGSSSGASVAVTDSTAYVCTELISSELNDIYTIINTKPDKCKFVVRGYTENETNNGVFVSNGFSVLNPDLSASGSNITQSFSNDISAVFKNTVAIIKNVKDTIKYFSVHVRYFTSNGIEPGEAQNSIRVVKINPSIRKDFLPPLILGDYCEVFTPSYISIDTENKTLSFGSSFTVKCGTLVQNTCAIDVSNLDKTVHQTFYYDKTENKIKVIAYGSYKNISNVEETAYIGSLWAANNNYPDGYYSFNSPAEIYVNGTKQNPVRDYNRNKKIVLYGDSICHGTTTGSEVTAYTLDTEIEKYIGWSATNEAIGGSSYCARTTRSDAICQIISNASFDYDYILFFAGTNDYGSDRVIGTISDTPSNENGNTFYSAVRYVIEYVLAQKPTIQIAIVTPTFRNYVSSGGRGNAYTTVRNSAGATLGDYCDALIAIGEYYNIPVYDMRKNSAINCLNYATTLEEQSSGSNLYLHPKNNTYYDMNRKIINWLKNTL